MTRKQRRGVLIIVGLALVSVAVGLSLWAMQSSVTYFKSPSDVAKQQPAPGERFRLGGLVEESHKGPGATLTFRLTDCANSLPVTYSKEVPDLFRDGQGAIAEGRLGADGVFVADTVLATDIGGLRSGFLLAQHRDDLLLGEPRPLHRPSPFGGRTLPTWAQVIPVIPGST